MQSRSVNDTFKPSNLSFVKRFIAFTFILLLEQTLLLPSVFLSVSPNFYLYSPRKGIILFVSPEQPRRIIDGEKVTSLVREIFSRCRDLVTRHPRLFTILLQSLARRDLWKYGARVSSVHARGSTRGQERRTNNRFGESLSIMIASAHRCAII